MRGLLFLLLLAGRHRAVGGTTLCESMQAFAETRLGTWCGCDSPVCGLGCLTEETGSAWCLNTCKYCSLDQCVTHATASSVQDFRDYDVGIIQYNTATFFYETGPYAGIQLVLSIPQLPEIYNTCSMQVVDYRSEVATTTECACNLFYCADGTTIHALVDCSNIEAGATANFCNTAADYEIQRDGLLGGFLVPAIAETELLCADNAVIDISAQVTGEQPLDDGSLYQDEPPVSSEGPPTNNAASDTMSSALHKRRFLLMIVLGWLDFLFT